MNRFSPLQKKESMVTQQSDCSYRNTKICENEGMRQKMNFLLIKLAKVVLLYLWLLQPFVIIFTPWHALECNLIK